jgi:hypothetical protein
VYGPNNDGERSVLWDEMVGLISWWEMPWCFGGDFNAVRFPSERLGDFEFSAAMEEISEFIFVQRLVDLPLQGGQFTWYNSQEDQVWSKIDRFLLSPECEEHFLEVTQRRLPRILSNHFPILLDCGMHREGSIYFKFENMCLKSEGFVEQVNLWWASYEFHGLPSYVLANKLKALKVDLKKWNEEVFSDVGKTKELLEGIRDLDYIDESRGLVEEERMRKTYLTKELEKMLLFDEVNWRQKSRALWLKEGDNNMKFFHRMANSHHR